MFCVSVSRVASRQAPDMDSLSLPARSTMNRRPHRTGLALRRPPGVLAAAEESRSSLHLAVDSTSSTTIA